MKTILGVFLIATPLLIGFIAMIGKYGWRDFLLSLGILLGMSLCVVGGIILLN